MRILVIFVATSLLPIISSANVSDVCSYELNPSCTCSGNSSDFAVLASIQCTFNSLSVSSPLFLNSSLANIVTVPTLDLSGNSFSHLPDNFFNGEIIDSLSLKNNNLSELPVAVTKVGHLRELDASFNELVTLSFSVLEKVPGLEIVDLSSNKLYTVSNVDAGGSTGVMLDIKELNLARNAIDRIEAGFFSRLDKLDTLDLSHNRLSQLTLTTFSGLTQCLTSLDLSNNSLNDVQDLEFKSLQQIRTLKLAHNKLGEVLGLLKFPEHLSQLDLTDCDVISVDRCQFADLTDLISLSLGDNPLKCTCDLFFLYQRFQGHQLSEGEWTCRNVTWPLSSSQTDPVTPTLSIGADQGLRDLSGSGQQMLVSLLHDHCPYSFYSPCVPTRDAVGQISMALNVDSSGSDLDISWTFEMTSNVSIDGFRIHYRPEDGDDIVSGIVPPDQRRLSMDTSDLSSHFVVCVDVLKYDAIIFQECANVQDNTGSIVVGILAGVIFLAPCIMALIYVFLKDRHILKGQYQHVEDIEDVEQQKVENGNSVRAYVQEARAQVDGGVAQFPTTNKHPEAVISEPKITQTSGSGVNKQGEPSEAAIEQGSKNETVLPSSDHKVEPKGEGIENTGYQCGHGNGDDTCGNPLHESSRL